MTRMACKYTRKHQRSKKMSKYSKTGGKLLSKRKKYKKHHTLKIKKRRSKKGGHCGCGENRN